MELEIAGIVATTNHSYFIFAVMPLSHDSGPDRLIWKWMSKGKFSSASTYSYFLNQRELVQWEHSSRIWKNDASQITNEVRVKRRMTDKGCCPQCDALVEIGLHVVRDCPFATNIWKSSVPQHDCYSNMDLIATSIAWARNISNLERLNNSCCSEYTKEYWQPVLVGWVKGNIDGSIPKHTSSTLAGSVIRNRERNWLIGFGKRIDRYGIF
ncbi:hypothetical protein PVK06_019001 [Gossypium arboreum]|uniref:Reverse transcriptase zinc-binding domain-containing protein n=1 Tax=Gossypium arboreum TaxID=29729 RepID=A0ABR0PIR1_GOSAR|nr:hypothetical protein PVK06_019001 [Gossypium arboreum]